MSVEINIHTKKCKINKGSTRAPSECVNMSEEKMIEIQAEAYYRALKRIEEEKKECTKEKVVEKRKYKFWEKVVYILNVIFFPWKISKNFKLNGMYDTLLVMIISLILQIAGTLMWLGGILVVANSLFGFVPNVELEIYMGFLPILFGSIVVISGVEFSKETDSNKIYAYSASIIAIISCIVSIAAIYVSK